MKRLTRSVLEFVQASPTAVEYAIVAVCVAAISTIGNNVDEMTEQVSSAFH